MCSEPGQPGRPLPRPYFSQGPNEQGEEETEEGETLNKPFALTRWAPRESLANPWMASLVPPQGNYEEKLYVFTQECPRGANALWHERKKKRLRSRLNY